MKDIKGFRWMRGRMVAICRWSQVFQRVNKERTCESHVFLGSEIMDARHKSGRHQFTHQQNPSTSNSHSMAHKPPPDNLPLPMWCGTQPRTSRDLLRSHHTPFIPDTLFETSLFPTETK
jgi:hypothetical protein